MLRVQSLESAEVLTRRQLKNVLGGVVVITTTNNDCQTIGGFNDKCPCANPVDWCLNGKCYDRANI